MSLLKFSEKVFLDQKLNNWIGYAIFTLIAIAIGYLMAYKLLLGIGFTAGICILALVIVCLLNTEIGLYLNIAYAFFIGHFNRLLFDDSLPVGVFSDCLIIITFLSLFVRKVNLRESFREFSKTSVAIMLLLVYCCMALELFNPSTSSFTGWFQAFRRVLGSFLLLFISFNVFDSYDKIRRFIIVLFVFSGIAAVYGCIQQWHGLFQFEMDWIMKDPRKFAQTFINGNIRKMSTMPDGLAFSMVMAGCGVFFISLGSGEKRLGKKIIILLGAVFMVLGMSYSGIRTAIAMLVAGLVMYMLLTINKLSTKLLLIGSSFIFLVLLYGPFESPQIDSFRSAFEGTKDDSYNVRKVNRNYIQPYIYQHPLGGGLGTTGAEGMTYNPRHFLAGFPPDSGYLKKALEMGWIGLALINILYFFVLKSGISGYFACKNEKFKTIYAACTAACFAFYLGDFSQVAIGQITDIVVYYPFIAIILKLKDFDQPSKILKHETKSL